MPNLRHVISKPCNNSVINIFTNISYILYHKSLSITKSRGSRNVICPNSPELLVPNKYQCSRGPLWPLIISSKPGSSLEDRDYHPGVFSDENTSTLVDRIYNYLMLAEDIFTFINEY